MKLQRYFGKSDVKMYPKSGVDGWCMGPEVAKLEEELEGIKKNMSDRMSDSWADSGERAVHAKEARANEQ